MACKDRLYTNVKHKFHRRGYPPQSIIVLSGFNWSSIILATNAKVMTSGCAFCGYKDADIGKQWDRGSTPRRSKSIQTRVEYCWT